MIKDARQLVPVIKKVTDDIDTFFSELPPGDCVVKFTVKRTGKKVNTDVEIKIK